MFTNKGLFALGFKGFGCTLLSNFRFRLFVYFLLAPSLVPSLVIAHNSSSTSLRVIWSYMPEEHFQGKPVGYSISYYPVDLRGDADFKNVNYSLNYTTLTNLTVYTMYVINVSAVSSGGMGPANTVKARTGAEGTNL